MKKIIKVKTKNKKYDIVVESNYSLQNIVHNTKYSKIIILIDSKILFLLDQIKIKKNFHIISINY